MNKSFAQENQDDSAQRHECSKTATSDGLTHHLLSCHGLSGSTCFLNSQKIFPNSFTLALPFSKRFVGFSTNLQFFVKQASKVSIARAKWFNVHWAKPYSLIRSECCLKAPACTTICIKRTSSAWASRVWWQISAMSNSLHTSIYWVGPPSQ